MSAVQEPDQTPNMTDYGGSYQIETSVPSFLNVLYISYDPAERGEPLCGSIGWASSYVQEHMIDQERRVVPKTQSN